VLLLAGADAGSSPLFLIRKDSGRSFLHTSTWVQKGLSKPTGEKLTRGSADLPIYLNKIPQQTGNEPAAGNQAAAPNDDDARASLPR
jgi:hypothetical protein